MQFTQLEELRSQIDEVDKQLLSLLKQRMELVKQVGLYKAEQQLPPLDESRWRAVVESRLALARELGVDQKMVTAIFDRIHETALHIELQVGAKDVD